MTNPITPPPELVQQWASEWMQQQSFNRDNFMAARAAQWGWNQREPEIQAAADQELEACLAEINTWGAITAYGGALADDLRAARRPKPPSLKEHALDVLHLSLDRGYLKDEAADTIRRALEQLDG